MPTINSKNLTLIPLCFGSFAGVKDERLLDVSLSCTLARVGERWHYQVKLLTFRGFQEIFRSKFLLTVLCAPQYRNWLDILWTLEIAKQFFVTKESQFFQSQKCSVTFLINIKRVDFMRQHATYDNLKKGLILNI